LLFFEGDAQAKNDFFASDKSPMNVIFGKGSCLMSEGLKTISCSSATDGFL